TTSGLLPQPDATAKVAKTTNRIEPNQVLIAGVPQAADEPRCLCAHPLKQSSPILPAKSTSSNESRARSLVDL
ncbi:MAG TPA: hypothetical protein VHM25_17250, partial [Polyangiaceae bacterium]|nr:hypothetical protein [Polyangiaceae bacterium]